MRQAIAGMLWSKQFFFFDGDNWLDEHRSNPLHTGYRAARNSEWFHMLNEDIISMPDKWEYPWYAAWDLAFHTLPLSIVDPDFAKGQMELMLRSAYLHPNGQMPAYEWNFSDVNPPVHAFATLFLHRTDQALRGETDLEFLKATFNKLLLNFTWWVNRKDRFGKNVFEGGFLGLDNIGVFDRSAPLPTGGHLEQADGTAWMALFSQNMLELAVELAAHDPTYEDMVFKFAEHFYFIAAAMNRLGPDGMWDEEDGFYYDVLRLPDGSATRLKVRSMVGLLPLCATTVIEKWQRERVPKAMRGFQERLRRMPELSATMHPTGPGHFGVAERGIMALVNPERLRRILTKMLDENEFLGPHGIRSISKFHEQHPYVFHVNGQEHRVDYLPAESNTGMFGGNSNWRGPVWMPVNVLIVRALLNFYLYYGDNFKIECPTGSGKMMNLFEVSKEIADRLVRTFTRDGRGRRPVYGGTEKFQTDPHWRDLHPLLRVLPRRQRRRVGRQPSDRLDRARRQAHRALRPAGSRARAGRGQAGRVRTPGVRSEDEMSAWPTLPGDLRDQHVGVARRAEPETPEARGPRHGSGAGVGCHRLSRLRRRLVHGRLGAEPCRHRHLHAKRGAPRGFQESPPRFLGGGQRRLALLRAPLRRRRAPRRAGGTRRRHDARSASAGCG